MDFELDETHQAVRDLAEQILSDRSTPAHLREVEAGNGFDASTWTDLAKAGLVGIAAPDHVGGGGLGLVAAGEVAHAVGRHTAAVPYVQAVASAMTLAEAGQSDDLAELIDGARVVVPALDLGPDPATTRHPTLTAMAIDGGWRVSGEVQAVAFGGVAHQFVVPASLDGGERVLLSVPLDAPGLRRTATATTALLPAANIRFDAVEVDAKRRLGDGGAVDVLVDRLRVLTCRAMAGVCQGTLTLAAAYTSEREQFGSKIGTFQAVAHRLADAYIDGQAIDLTSRQAAWRVEEGLDSTRELSGACFWAAEGGQRIVHATQHVHGGIGVDTDYPQHRYFRWAKDLELQLGGANRSLVELGADLARVPAGMAD